MPARYEVLRVDDADRNDYTGTTIEVLTGNTAAAKVLAQRLKVPEAAIKAVPTTNSNVEIRVIVGRP